jgi:hypothetical protein
VPFDLVRWARIRGGREVGDGWAIAPLSAHHYGVLAHFTTLERQLDELAHAGLDRDVVIVESERGERVRAGDDTSHVTWFHFAARPR